MTDPKPEILFIAHRIPYPPNKGDKIRSWRLLQHLTKKFSVHLACFIDDPEDFAHTKFLTSICKSAVFIPLNPLRSKVASLTGFLKGESLSVRYYASTAMSDAIRNIRQRPLVAEIVFSSTMAQYVAVPKKERSRIVDFCDADSEKWKQYASDAGPVLSWVYRREAEKLGNTETQVANWADTSFAISPDEAALFNQRSHIQSNVHWWSNGVDTTYFDPEVSVRFGGDGADLVFTGAMDYRANVDAVLYFEQNVWPVIRNALPKATLSIVGSNPAKQILALDANGRINVTGRVDDIRPWLQNAKVAIAPMRVGRGIQNKVLEAMAMALPVVTTREAATGIVEDVQNAIKIADSPAEMAQVIIGLLNDELARKQAGMLARRAVSTQYDWDKQLSRFNDIALAGFLGHELSSNESSSKLVASTASS